MQTQLMIKIAVIAVILSVIGFFIYDYKTTKHQLETKKAELTAVHLEIKSQNEAIEKLKLDVELYKNKKPQIIEKIVTKYQNIEVIKPDATCEERYAKLEEYVKVFYNRKGSKNYLAPSANSANNETTITNKEEREAAKEAVQILEEERLKAAQDYVDKMLGKGAK